MDPQIPYTLHEPLLTLKDVSKSYGTTCVLRDVNGVVHDVHRDGTGILQGQVVALLGPSGVGKSTLLRLIAGLEKPTSGEILVGKDQVPTKAGLVGVVAQNYPLFEDRSVMDNLVLGARKGGASKKEAPEKAREMLARFQLEHRANAYPCQLSGGQRQRVAIAQQLLCSSHLLILDEPFSGLDPRMKDEACEIILETSRLAEDMTIVAITHDLREGIKVADEIWYMGHHTDGNGAGIVDIRDLKAGGLAWRPDLTRSPEFNTLEREVRDRFKTL